MTFSNDSPAACAATDLDACDRLGAEPDFAFIVAEMHGAIHRLHRGVRQERNLIDCFELSGGGRDRAVGVADVLRHSTRAKRRLLELFGDIYRRNGCVRTIVPFDPQCFQAFLRGAHVIGNNRYGIVEPHDLAHALDSFRCGVIDALYAPAEHRRLRQCRDLHAGRARVDPIDCAAVDLARDIEPLGRRADQLELVGGSSARRSWAVASWRRPRQAQRMSAFGRSANGSPCRPARGTPSPRRPSVSPQPRPAWFARSRPLRAAASMRRASHSNCRSPARPATDYGKAFRSAEHVRARTWSRPTSSSSAISIGIEV